MSGALALCFLASAKNWMASSCDYVAIEGDKVRNPKTIKDREQQQGIFGRFSERMRLFNQRARPLDRSSGFRRRVTADMQERRYQLHVKLDLLAPKRRRARQGCDHVERTSKLLL